MIGVNMLQNINRTLVAQLLAFHVLIIATSNYLVQFPVTVAGISFTWAMFTFPLVILATDLTVRLSNKYNARWIVGLAYIPAIIISTLLADWRIGVASGTAYLISQLLDVSVFNRIREAFKTWWYAPVVATFVSNIIDTYTFFGVAFYNSADPFMAENWFHIASVDLVFKMIVSYLVIIPLYGIVLKYALGKVQD
jgi:uncharacterized PurR-regulated membrane protein YhhQ (DUF165 family)